MSATASSIAATSVDKPTAAGETKIGGIGPSLWPWIRIKDSVVIATLRTAWRARAIKRGTDEGIKTIIDWQVRRDMIVQGV